MFYVGEKFDIEKNKEYKTLDGAKKGAEKAGLCVFDEVGVKVYPLKVQMTDNVPEGALEDNPDGSVNVYSEDGEKIGTVTAEEAEEASILPDDVTEEDIEAAAKAAEYEQQEKQTDQEQEEDQEQKEDQEQDGVEKVEGMIRRVFQGKLRLRRKPSMDPDAVCGVTMFDQKRAIRKHTVGGVVMYETSDGYFISGDPAHVEFIPDRA